MVVGHGLVDPLSKYIRGGEAEADTDSWHEFWGKQDIIGYL